MVKMCLSRYQNDVFMFLFFFVPEYVEVVLKRQSCHPSWVSSFCIFVSTT